LNLAVKLAIILVKSIHSISLHQMLIICFVENMGYENRLGNKMDIINTLTGKEDVVTSKFKIQVHSETRFIQLNEVEEIADIISTHYKNHIKREIQLYPIVAELALDHFTNSLTFITTSIRDICSRSITRAE